MTTKSISLAAALMAAVMGSNIVSAQSTTAPNAEPKDTTVVVPIAPEPAPPPPPVTAGIPISFSSVVFGNFQYRGDNSAQSANSFQLDRAYLTFRASLGSGLSARITADVYQQTSSPSDAYYRGWALRMKYAYMQYDYMKRGSGLAGAARFGMVHNGVIESEEPFWPRWLSTVPVERAGYFSSADMGAATVITLPRKFGEFYAAVVNGPGYTSRETDRFKDVQARLSLTPFNESTNPFLRKLTLTAWTYQGATASSFVNGGTGQVSAVGESLTRTRWGTFAGINDPRITLAVQYASRKDERETGLNTVASPRAVVDSTGGLFSAYTVMRPFRLINSTSETPIRMVFRWDHIKPNVDTDPNYHTVIGGLIWDVSKRGAFALDYQEQTPHKGTSVAANKTYFLHWMVSF